MNRRSLLALAGSGLLLTACGGNSAGTGPGASAGSSGSGPAPTSMTWGVTTAPDVIDVAHGLGVDNSLVQGAVLDTVLAWDTNGGVAPSLATSWTESKPGTYVFTLRSGVKFSDGSPMTAQDVAYSLQRHADPAVGSKVSWAVADLESVTVTGTDEVTVTLKGSSPTFLYYLPIAWQVVPEKLAKAHLQDLGTPQNGVIGTGPYRVTAFSLADGVTLQPNEHYWGPAPLIGTVKVSVVANSDSLRLALETGSVDAARVPSDGPRTWDALAAAKVNYYATNSVLMLSMNVQDEILSDLHVRRAIAHAVDRRTVAKLGAGEHAQPKDTVLSDTVLQALYGPDHAKALDGLAEYPYDVDAAKAELAKSAHPNGFDMKVTTLAGQYGNAWQAVVADLAAIGIRLTLDPITRDKYFARRMRHEGLTMEIAPYGGITAEAAEVLPDLVGAEGAEPGGSNMAQFTTPQMTADLKKVLNGKGSDRIQAVTDILTAVADQVPYLPLAQPQEGFAVNKRFAASIGLYTQDLVTAVRPG